MRSSFRAGLALVVAVGLLQGAALTATAAVANDTPSAATPTTLGQTYTQDTTDGETEALDATLNQSCGAPAALGSVWYTYTSDGQEGAGFLVDGSGSTYDLGIMVVEGDPANGGELVACGPTKVATYTIPGETYYIMAFTANAVDPVGGDLSLQILPAPDAPTVSVTVGDSATAFKDGSVLLTGTYSCTDSEYAEIGGSLTQRVGRLKITGDFYLSDLTCDGGTYLWEALATSSNGYFAGGKAASVSFAFVCGALECADSYAESTLRLTRAKK